MRTCLCALRAYNAVCDNGGPAAETRSRPSFTFWAWALLQSEICEAAGAVSAHAKLGREYPVTWAAQGFRELMAC